MRGYHQSVGFGRAARHQFGENLQAVFFWHPKIQDENIRTMLTAQCTRFLAIRGFTHYLYILLTLENGD